MLREITFDQFELHDVAISPDGLWLIVLGEDAADLKPKGLRTEKTLVIYSLTSASVVK